MRGAKGSAGKDAVILVGGGSESGTGRGGGGGGGAETKRGGDGMTVCGPAGPWGVTPALAHQGAACCGSGATGTCPPARSGPQQPHTLQHQLVLHENYLVRDANEFFLDVNDVNLGTMSVTGQRTIVLVSSLNKCTQQSSFQSKKEESLIPACNSPMLTY